VRTHAAGFRAAVLPVYFALVAEETARIGEAADVVAFRFFADVGTRVLVHMLTVGLVSSISWRCHTEDEGEYLRPLALSRKYRRLLRTFLIGTVQDALRIPRRLRRPPAAVS